MIKVPDRSRWNSGGITDELKAIDQMKWVGLMKNAKSSIEKIVLREPAYV